MFSTEDLKKFEEINLEPIEKHRAALGSFGSDAPIAEQPEGMKKKMKKHQLMMISEAERRENLVGKMEHTPTGIKYKDAKILVLMPGPGTGKSDTVIARILQQTDLRRKRLRPQHSILTNNAYDSISMEFTEYEEYGQLNWIVVPHGVIHQWKGFLSETELNYSVITHKKDVEDMKNRYTQEVWLISSSRYKEVVETYDNTVNLSRIVFDECDTIQIPNCRVPNAVFYWFVTASAQNIFYPNGTTPSQTQLRNGTQRKTQVASGIKCTGFIKTTLISVNRNVGDLIVNAPYKVIDESIKLPEARVEFLNVEQSVLRSTLEGTVNKTVLAMINAKDYEGMAKHFGVKTVTNTRQLIDGVLSAFQKDLKETKTQETQTLATRKKITKLEEDIEKIKKRLEKNGECMICYAVEKVEDEGDDLIENPTITPCCHKMWCFECIVQILKDQKPCPNCKAILNPKTLISIMDKEIEVEKEEKIGPIIYKTKEDAFAYILKKLSQDKNPHRILCFAEFEGSLKRIEGLCAEAGVITAQLKGTGVSIKNKITKWENSKTSSVLLLNAKRFGAGLNLQTGTDIILWHRLSAKVDGRNDLERQVLGRVLRFGVKEAPTIWKLSYPEEY